MIAFPGMLVPAAERAGMKCPSDPYKFEEEKEACPHFFVFCILQLARPTVYHGEHWDNAKIIAAIPESELMEMTLGNFLSKGISWAQ